MSSRPSSLRSTAAPEPAASDRWTPPPVIKASALLHAAVVAGCVAAPSQWPKGLALIAGNHVAVGLCGMMPRASYLGRTVTRMPEDPSDPRPKIALTLDDGPDPDVTPAVLDLLDAHGAQATFFCIGRRVEAHPGLAREIVDRGHRIENHTYRHHHSFAFRFVGGLHREIERAQKAIADVTGRRPSYFRAPAGMRSFMLDPVLNRMGLTLVAWTRRGYDAVVGDADRVVPRLVRGLRDGDILLLHDGNCARSRSGKPVVIEALGRTLELCDRRGFRAVGLPEGL